MTVIVTPHVFSAPSFGTKSTTLSCLSSNLKIAAFAAHIHARTAKAFMCLSIVVVPASRLCGVGTCVYVCVCVVMVHYCKTP